MGFRPGPTKTSLHSQRSRLETINFGFKKKRNCTICVAKIKALISFAVTTKLICAFVFAYADCLFSCAVAQLSLITYLLCGGTEIFQQMLSICTLYGDFFSLPGQPKPVLGLA